MLPNQTSNQISDKRYQISRLVTSISTITRRSSNRRVHLFNHSNLDNTDQLVYSYKTEILNKDEEIHKSQQEKMETFKQFRALNNLYEDLKSEHEVLEKKKNITIDKLKDVEYKFEISRKQKEEISEKYKFVASDYERMRKDLESIKIEKARLQLEKNEMTVSLTPSK